LARSRHSGTSGRGWSLPKTVVTVLIVIPFLYPLVFLLLTAMRGADAYNRSPLGLTGFPTLHHLEDAWNSGSLGQGALNSLVAVVVGVACCCFASSLAAYWFFRHDGPLAKALLGLILVGWLIPFAVYLVPFYIEFARLHFTNDLVMLGVAYGAVHTPFGTYFVLQYFRQGLSRDVLEAAAVDGASILRQFVRIALPLARPAVGTLAALAFVWMWGEIIVSVVLLSDQSKFTIVLSANTLVGQTINAGGSANTVQIVAAATLISLLPMLSVIYVAQRAIVRGFGAGAVK
jgi:ABC-type glycerol-3-phosphate transport system permease component